jgi:very-short-patch-repair endonuclease
MSSKVFLQTLQNKLKGGNARSIHLNALPGRLATRLDLKQLDFIDSKLSARFLNMLLTKANFEFKISFDQIDLNEADAEVKKKLGVISKRLNSIIIENEDYYKEHGIKTLGFGYPILIKRSVKDPTKIIKAPLFIWPLEAIKSKTKINEWTILRNKAFQANGKLVDDDIHSVGINEVLLSFIKGEENITLPNFTSEALEDALIDKAELLSACTEVLLALNSGTKAQYLATLKKNFETPVNLLPDAAQIDSIANNKAYLHFGGVFGLFRAQKESIITDITRLLERFDDFEFDDLVVEDLSSTPFSAVNTDPSQQAIINTLGSDVNQIIQGPPGTGKSQSLTALIINALANGLKCLVVCEKKTALDVIKRNIDRINPKIGNLLGIIDDVNDDREAIVDSVRDRQNGMPFNISGYQAQNNYDKIKSVLRKSVRTVNNQHKALIQSVYGDRTWSQLVGRYLSLKKKYQDVPLRSVLKVEDFSFHKNEKELDELLAVLKQANILFDRSKHTHEVFRPLATNLFQRQTAGEARARIEQYLAYVSSELPGMVNSIQKLQLEGKQWSDGFIAVIPNVIKNDLKPFFPFITGDVLEDKGLPLFKHEQLIDELMSTLDTLCGKAKKIKQTYQDSLHKQYNSYCDQLNHALTSYLSFASKSVEQHGDVLLDNSSGARIWTTVYSVFSDKHRQIKQDRVKIRSSIAEVRKVHLQKRYIHHDYNDHTESDDLSTYLSNIKELHQKTINWSKEYTSTINSWLSNIGEENFHADFSELKLEVIPLLQKLKAILQTIDQNYNITTAANVTDLNNLIDVIPALIGKLKIQYDHYRSFRDCIDNKNDLYKKLKESFDNLDNFKGTGKVHGKLIKPFNNLHEAKELCNGIKKELVVINNHLSDFREYHELRSFYLRLNRSQQVLVTLASDHLKDSWADGFECWYLFWVLSLNEPENLPKGDYEIRQYQQQKEEFNNAQLNSIIAYWIEKQTSAVREFKTRGNAVNSLFNKKGSKGMRRNSLRSIVNAEFQLFTDFFPVLLLNPSVCSSILPLEEGLFDLVIFDEASQLRLEETFAALIRGKAKIVSGDKHQMAPSSYFESSGALLDPIESEDADAEDDDDGIDRMGSMEVQRNLADSESLLAYAVDKGFKESYLSVHYRSQHPYLIDFSNHAFYGSRLIPIPAERDYTPIEFLQIDGVYEGQVNKAEAIKVVSLLKQTVRSYENEQCPSIGIATFNIYQRNLILDEIRNERQNDPVFDNLMAKVEGSFFVKNLENIQGDERDIIIISTTFGRKSNGVFTQNFGPIIQSKGHRMLNVIITRAKQKVYLCTSFPQEQVSQYQLLIQKNGNKGRGILYAYIAYAKAVSEKNDELRNNILQLMSNYCTDKQYEDAELSLGSESPFEEEVYQQLAQHIGANRIQQQFRMGGFRIDIIVKDKNTGLPLIAIECDGAKYHSSPEAYAWDCFRQEQLERYGLIFYRIWSTKWWDATDREMEQLLHFVRAHDEKD